MSIARTMGRALRLHVDGKNKFNLRLLIVSLVTVFGINAAHCSAQTNVTTYHNDIGRTGQNLNETILTTSNVNTNQFGKLFSQPVDGQIYAQPLYLPGLTIGGQVHNVVFVATENDSVYAFDADSNGGANASPLWQASLLTAAHGAASGATAFPASELAADITPLVGITGTPVIDPTSNTLYVVSKSLENSNAVQRLHALDVTTGNEKFGGPVVITATVAGTGNGSVSGQLTFDSMWENQRPALLLVNGIVYVGFAAHGDNGPWHGWILGYNAATLKQTGAYNASPNGIGAGFWMSGSGLAADVLNPSTQPYGRMFVTSGNGDYTATTPYSNSMDYGDSILNLNLANGVPTIQDEFTPSDQANLDAEDGDLGSGGVMLIPTQTTGSYPHLLVQVGKEGTLYLVNRDKMSGYNSTDAVVQEMAYAVGVNGAWSTAAYWNGNVYYMGRGDYLKSFALVNGQLSSTPTKSSEVYNYPGATPSISANGSTQGIVWTIDTEAYATSGPAILQAHNASNVAQTLYSSSTNSSRDNPGSAVKFAVPTVMNGKVYVGTGTQVSVFGLLSGTQQAATPVMSPGSESFTGSVSVTITDSTSGATIYYTTDGSTPTTSSTKYTGAITVSATETINAIASASNYLVSPVASATYTDVTQASAPTFSLAAGTYTGTQTVTISDSTSGATIYYTTNGTTPTTSSTKYTGAITVSATETIEAIAVASGLINSPVSSATYTIQTATGGGINYPQGFAASTGQIILNGSAQLDDSRLQLTDGGQYEAASAWYVTPVNVQSFTTDFTFQLSNPVADGITFAIQNNNNTIVGASAGNLGYGYIPNSLAIKFDLYNDNGEGPDSTGLYTEGTPPIVPAIDLSSTGINLHSDDTMWVHLVYDGTTLSMTITDNVTGATFSTSWVINIPATVGGNTAYVGFTGGTGYSSASQKILTWEFANGTVLPTPTFSVAAGTYSTTQSVTISDSNASAAIYYTTNGTAPTTSSAKYSGPISVSSTETLEAIAVETGYTNSAVAIAAYTINPVLPTPTFSVAAGTYSTTQSVTISDSNASAAIYYTTNGTTPTTSSAKYSGPISVSSTETLEAIAVETGYTNSAVAIAAYTINPVLPTPTFSDAAGTYSTTQSVTISDSNASATIYYTINGTTPTTSSAKYSGPISVSSTETLEAIAVETGYTNSTVAIAAYTISSTLPAPTFSLPSGTYTNSTLTITDNASGVTIYYTTNGTTPTTSSSVYTGTILFNVPGTFTVEAMAVKSGYTNSPVTSATYTIHPYLAKPTFTPAAGTYTTSQSVTISDISTKTIYYTTDGSTPTTSSPLYSGPITVSSNETINAIATLPGWTNSPVASATYTIVPVLPTPTFSVAAGTYSTTQSVAISDSVSGTIIYYTTNSTTPTTSSTKYTGPISVSASETLQAIAVETGYTNSAVATAAYTIQPVGASVNFASGFASSQGQMMLNGTSQLSGSGILLTNGGQYQAGTAWYATPLNVQAFTTDFTFQLTNAVADGFTFAIQNNNTTEVGASAANLGYGYIPNSIAIKFDLFNNQGEGSDSTGLFTNGNPPMVPAVDMTSSGVNLHSGDTIAVHLVYNGTTLTMTVTDTVTKASFTTSWTVNIPATIGADTAYVGFTGGTGYSTASQDILTWTYTP